MARVRVRVRVRPPFKEVTEAELPHRETFSLHGDVKVRERWRPARV